MEFENPLDKCSPENPIHIVFKTSDSMEEAGGSVNLYNGSVIQLFGSNIQAVWDIVETLNISTLAHFEDWSQSVKLVSNGTYDWGVPLMSLTEGLVNEGLASGDGLVFLIPLAAMTSNVYFRQPPAETIYVTMLRPFQAKVWIAFLSCVLISTLLAYKAFPKHLEKRNIASLSKSEIVLEMIQFLRGRFANDLISSNMNTRHSRIRSIAPQHKYQYLPILVGSLLGLFIVTIYTAKIAASFAQTDTIVQSADDLLKWKYAFTSFSTFHFQRVFTNPDLALRKETKFNGTLDAVNKVVHPLSSEPKFAFLTHSDGFYQYNRLFSHALCEVSSITSKTKVAQAMFLRKGCLLRESINLKIIHLIETGLNYRYQITYRRKYEYFCIKEEMGFTQLTTHHVSLAFMVLVAGVAFALLIEFVLHFRMYVKNQFWSSPII